MLPAWSKGGQHRVDRFAANPGLNAEPAAGYQGAQDSGHVGAQDAERGARENGEGNSIAGSCVSVQQHRNQDEYVSKKNGKEGLLPAHASGNHSAR
jgi:hypothetical protein